MSPKSLSELLTIFCGPSAARELQQAAVTVLLGAFLQLQAQCAVSPDVQAREESLMAAPSPGKLQGKTPATPLLGWHQPQVGSDCSAY